ncbi:Peptidyl-prolyl cis-trans isomerase pin4 [Malassezia nana]|uniref:Peptidyl-prolyl cis-trans isomerase pin4 n=1 Tax=Malassezia nana TaxID=180528 RepID=A0AAF0EJ10_9BASI|nr:Peptidyl-prolyl cis-trans isomerase pin4 [Malassezia nana]
MLGSGNGLPSSALPQARAPSPFLSGPWSGLPGQNGGIFLPSEHHSPANSPATLPMNPTIRFGNSLPATLSGDADIIPTAIVIKNIPFNIKREQLLHVIRDLGIPVPYAFNYHFDQGIFRGLAFANFHSPAEASEVVNALNGLEVSGRKLRVEYKKVLQAGEKERIEKEKAMKRMQFSPYLDKERKKEKSPTFENAALHVHIPPMRGSSPSPGVSVPHRSSEPLPGFSFPRLPPQDPSDPALDLNDASTLEIYSRVLLFKDDRMRDELSFSKSLTAEERRVVHLVSHKLGLYHYTLGTGDDCFVLVTKTHMPNLGASDRLKPQDALSTFKSNHSATPNDLLTKKSVPDMKRMMQNEHHRSSSPALMHRSAGLLTPCGSTSMARKSTCSPRDALSQAADPRFDGFGSFGGRSSHSQNLFAYPVDALSVPYISHSNASGDVDSTDFVPSSCLPPLHRSRSPLHRVHSPMSTSIHSTPVTPLSQTMGPLDHAISPFGTVSSEPGLHQNSPVICDELPDNSPYPSAHSPVRSVFGDRPSLMLDINAIMMGQADDKPSSTLAPPKITKSSASDNP